MSRAASDLAQVPCTDSVVRTVLLSELDSKFSSEGLILLKFVAQSETTMIIQIIP